uniref:Uncharacterized protein n=1 Tax=Ciona savignyi TaxID=51511 RepID=H2Z8D6_CIOSA
MLLTNQCHDLITRSVQDYGDVLAPRMYFVSPTPLMQYPCQYGSFPNIDEGFVKYLEEAQFSLGCFEPPAAPKLKIKQRKLVTARQKPYRKTSRSPEANEMEPTGMKSPILLRLLQSPDSESQTCQRKSDMNSNSTRLSSRIGHLSSENTFGFVEEILQKTEHFFESVPMLGDPSPQQRHGFFLDYWAEVFIIFCAEKGIEIDAIEKSVRADLDSHCSKRDIHKLHDFVKRCQSMNLSSLEYEYLRGAVLGIQDGFINTVVSPKSRSVRSSQISLNLLALRSVSSQRIADLFLRPVFGCSDIEKIQSGSSFK